MYFKEGVQRLYLEFLKSLHPSVQVNEAHILSAVLCTLLFFNNNGGFSFIIPYSLERIFLNV